MGSAKEEIVKCRNNHEIQLKDKNGSAKKSIKDINKSFDKLNKPLKNFGK